MQSLETSICHSCWVWDRFKGYLFHLLCYKHLGPILKNICLYDVESNPQPAILALDKSQIFFPVMKGDQTKDRYPSYLPTLQRLLYIHILYIITTWCSLDEARYCKYTGRFCFCRALTDRSWSWDTHGSTCYKSRLRKKNTFMCATLGPIPLDLSLAPHLFHSTWSMKPDLINLVKEQHLVSNWNWIAIPEWPKHHHFYPPHGPTLSKP